VEAVFWTEFFRIFPMISGWFLPKVQEFSRNPPEKIWTISVRSTVSMFHRFLVSFPYLPFGCFDE
jgi:hypothetical protein